jgi:hypothetical protein
MSEQAPASHEAGKLGEDAQAVLDAARDAARARIGNFTRLRELFAAEVGLARDALVRALIYLLVCTVMLGTAYLLLTALLVSGLRAAGAPWPLAIGIPLVLSSAVAVFSIFRARTMLHHADFEATRRQLKHSLGNDPDPDPPS